jgi:hypothetical protein
MVVTPAANEQKQQQTDQEQKNRAGFRQGQAQTRFPRVGELQKSQGLQGGFHADSPQKKGTFDSNIRQPVAQSQAKGEDKYDTPPAGRRFHRGDLW